MEATRCAVVLFTRDLRLHDNPALAAAVAAAEHVVPLFVLEPRLLAVSERRRSLLEATGFMHGRARMVVASFPTKDLRVDWREGAAHFMRLLLDGDVASNSGNWQWVAGTGADTRPGRIFNPTLQARRHDPDGAYVHRWVPELAAVRGAAVHEPWRLVAGLRRGYPAPILDHDDAAARFRAERGS